MIDLAVLRDDIREGSVVIISDTGPYLWRLLPGRIIRHSSFTTRSGFVVCVSLLSDKTQISNYLWAGCASMDGFVSPIPEHLSRKICAIALGEENLPDLAVVQV
jgi:hypothetical protein